MTSIKVTTADGLTLAAQEWGNPAGPAILFIHGFNQCHLSWARQVGDETLAAQFRIVTFDLRGHGGSDKPVDPAAYREDKIWADDLAAVIAAAGLKRPVLVGWSYGGRVIGDYVRSYGAGAIAGIDFVAALTKADGALMGPAKSHFRGMVNEDLATAIAATRGFLRACFERQPTADEFETMLAFNMVVPPKVRAAVLARGPDAGEVLARLDVPVLVTHGAKDQVVLPAMGAFTAEQVPGARHSVYAGIGHAPFWEDPARFNRELAAFVRAIAS
jgi:pimeloyl-ACP methyl ester carboxylesterase